MATKDTRGKLKVDPKVALEDYSGPFKPDLAYADFSREQLLRMYLMSQEYAITIALTCSMWVMEKHGFEAMIGFQHDIWVERMVAPAHEMIDNVMGIKGGDLESLMKTFQIDLMSGPLKFDMTFEMPSKDRGVVTFIKCPALEMMEPFGDEVLGNWCRTMCPPSNLAYGKSFNPDIELTTLKIPPRKSKDDVCCIWEYNLKPK